MVRQPMAKSTTSNKEQELRALSTGKAPKQTRRGTPVLDWNMNIACTKHPNRLAAAEVSDGSRIAASQHSAIIDRQATAIIPIRKNGRPWKEDCPAAIDRNETRRATRHYGRAFWRRWAGYHIRSRIEAKMRSLKAFGERIAARDPDRQTAAIHIRGALMNRYNTLGTAEIVRVE